MKKSEMLAAARTGELTIGEIVALRDSGEIGERFAGSLIWVRSNAIRRNQYAAARNVGVQG